VLDELDRRNLFVARFAGERGPAWRYHDLFADFLRDRLNAERSMDAVVDLHRRAAEALPATQAVPHLLAAGEYDRVAEIALAISFERLDPGLLSLVLPWVEALPGEVIDRHPRLALLLVWPDEMAGRHTGSSPGSSRSMHGSSTPGGDRCRGDRGRDRPRLHDER
jgi:LuxR family transcriptional regulator, maltose regulon positive regulatory protein